MICQSLTIETLPKSWKFSACNSDTNLVLWCPPDDEILDAAEEYLSEQYDREIEEFYLQALEAHEAGPHGQQEHQSVPDQHEYEHQQKDELDESYTST